jgi:hypothetical protein
VACIVCVYINVLGMCRKNQTVFVLNYEKKAHRGTVKKL